MTPHILEGAITATDTLFIGDSLVGVVLVVFKTSWSCAVIFSGSEYGLPLESVSSTMGG